MSKLTEIRKELKKLPYIFTNINNDLSVRISSNNVYVESNYMWIRLKDEDIPKLIKALQDLIKE